MKRHRSLAVVLSALVLAGPALAADPAPAKPKETEIPFANLGGIYNWQADGDRGLFIEGRNRKWYYATVMSPCLDLPFAQSIGFVSHPAGDFDKFSSILVKGKQCHVMSLIDSPPPAKKQQDGPRRE